VCRDRRCSGPKARYRWTSTRALRGSDLTVTAVDRRSCSVWRRASRACAVESDIHLAETRQIRDLSCDFRRNDRVAVSIHHLAAHQTGQRMDRVLEVGIIDVQAARGTCAYRKIHPILKSVSFSKVTRGTA
jgi:hypothetical protein